MSARWLLFVVVLLAGQVFADLPPYPSSDPAQAAALPTMHSAAYSTTQRLIVDGVERTALIFPGKDAQFTPAPLVLVFHGFTGNSWNMSRIARIHELWPEATVVYPQGLRVYSRRLRRMVPAWQPNPGRDNDRDVHFIDMLLDTLRTAYKVDEARIYATGSSNGAMFCYTLFIMRPQHFAAFGIVAGSSENIQDATIPRPFLIIHGTKDTSVPMEQAVKARDFIRCLNGCGEKTKKWDTGYLSYQPCPTDQPVIWHQHPGGHIWPVDASTQIVRFFKEHTLPEEWRSLLPYQRPDTIPEVPLMSSPHKQA